MVDNLMPSQRSYCMSRVKGKDTCLEKRVRSELFRRGIRFRVNDGRLPGRPDIVFSKAKIAVFLDGDFWHGYRFPAWKHKLTEFWMNKISKNRARDIKNRRKLKNMGWRVIKLWQHEIEEDFDDCIERIEAESRRGRPCISKQRAVRQANL